MELNFLWSGTGNAVVNQLWDSKKYYFRLLQKCRKLCCNIKILNETRSQAINLTPCLYGTPEKIRTPDLLVRRIPFRRNMLILLTRAAVFRYNHTLRRTTMHYRVRQGNPDPIFMNAVLARLRRVLFPLSSAMQPAPVGDYYQALFEE